MKSSLLSTCLVAAAAAVPAQAFACALADVQGYVVKLGHKDDAPDHSDAFKCFAEHGKEAAAMLIKELHPVAAAKIADEGKYPSAMHVIWAMRGLYALTGLNPVGGAREDISDDKKLSENQRYWITYMSSGGVHMFGVWDSRDVIYIAPPDAQAAIIAKWKAWYAKDGASFHYAYDPDKNWWYRGYGEPGNEPIP